MTNGRRSRAETQTTYAQPVCSETATIEHSLARVQQIQGHKARYKGIRKNTLDLRRVSAVANLQRVSPPIDRRVTLPVQLSRPISSPRRHNLDLEAEALRSVADCKVVEHAIRRAQQLIRRGTAARIDGTRITKSGLDRLWDAVTISPPSRRTLSQLVLASTRARRLHERWEAISACLIARFSTSVCNPGKASPDTRARPHGEYPTSSSARRRRDSCRDSSEAPARRAPSLRKWRCTAGRPL